MTDQKQQKAEARRRKVESLIKELAAIQVEVDVLKGEVEAEACSILAVLDAEALGEASNAVEDALGALKEAIA